MTCQLIASRKFRLVVIALILCLGQVECERGMADEPSSTAQSAAEIVVPDVRMKLKEHRELTSGRPGRIARVMFSRGQRVKKGDLLVQLEDDEVRTRLATVKKKASSDIETRYARKAYEVAEADLEAAREANSRLGGTIPEAEVRKLDLTAQRGALQVEQAQLQDEISKLEVEEINAQLEAYQVFSPIDGRVSEVHKQVGEGVQQGEVIVEVVSSDKLLAEGYVSVLDAEQIRRGCRVTVRHRDRSYGGMVIDIEQQATFVGDNVKIFVEFSTQPLLKKGTEMPSETPGTRILAGLKAEMVIHSDELVSEAAK